MADPEDIEFESDPEDAKLSLKLRRREASDDEEEDEVAGSRGGELPRRTDDSESEGAAAEYEDEEGEGEEEYSLDEEEEYLDDEVEVRYEVVGGGEGVQVERAAGVGTGEGEVAAGVLSGNRNEREEVSNDALEVDIEDDSNVADGEHEGDRKEAEPFTVPTAGAFYMHDDRFQDSARGRNRYLLVP